MMKAWWALLAVIVGTNANVTLMVVNDIAKPTFSYAKNVTVAPGVSVYEMMLQAERDFDFRFKATYYSDQSSHYVCSVYGLDTSAEAKTYWGFENGKQYQFDRGVDLILLYENDTITFRYTKDETTGPGPMQGSFTADQCAKFMN